MYKIIQKEMLTPNICRMVVEAPRLAAAAKPGQFLIVRADEKGERIMKARAARLHAANDVRIDEFELPPIKDDEILVKIVCDSICMSTYKMAKLGVEHKRVHADVADHPAILGHELAGDIVEVGAKYKDKYKPGMKFTHQPALNYKGSMDSPGYSYEFCGGDTTYCIMPMEVFE